jgi:hypothetical protein
MPAENVVLRPALLYQHKRAGLTQRVVSGKFFIFRLIDYVFSRRGDTFDTT